MKSVFLIVSGASRCYIAFRDSTAFSRLVVPPSAFNKSQLEPDPLQFPHMFENEMDIEVMAFIASVFSYGNVIQIINTLDKIVKIMNYHPFNFVIQFDIKTDAVKFRGVNHRFYTFRSYTTHFIQLEITFPTLEDKFNLPANGIKFTHIFRWHIFSRRICNM